MNLHTSHNLKSGFNAITACNKTSKAFGHAVQDLIKKDFH